MRDLVVCHSELDSESIEISPQNTLSYKLSTKNRIATFIGILTFVLYNTFILKNNKDIYEY